MDEGTHESRHEPPTATGVRPAEIVVLVLLVVAGLAGGVWRRTSDALRDVAREWSPLPRSAALPAFAIVGVPDATDGVRTDADRAVVQEIRAGVAAGRAVEIAASIDARIGAGTVQATAPVRFERSVLATFLDPTLLDDPAEVMALRETFEPGAARRGARVVGGLALAEVPSGFAGTPGPGSTYARTYLRQALCVAGLSGWLDLRVDGALVGRDPERLVTLLDTPAGLATVLPPDDPLMVRGRLSRERVQQVLVGGGAAVALADVSVGPADAAADTSRTARERAVAAQALTDLADIPIRRRLDLPLDDDWRRSANEALTRLGDICDGGRRMGRVSHDVERLARAVATVGTAADVARLAETPFENLNGPFQTAAFLRHGVSAATLRFGGLNDVTPLELAGLLLSPNAEVRVAEIATAAYIRNVFGDSFDLVRIVALAFVLVRLRDTARLRGRVLANDAAAAATAAVA